MLVYYYYQFVYKLVYYNNKTDNADPSSFTSILDNSSTSKTDRQHFASSSKLNHFTSPNCRQGSFSADFC